ncbi:MAG: DUF1385 domain-containing protein [candidate division KSB1 bacterium]|nr:DUF1385 domain-containing protein [candidate division KSB1 bacterium]
MKAKEKVTVGGQAVMEGVMMRGPERVAVAVRKPDGTIVVKDRKFESVIKRFKPLGWPVLRGAVTLIESLVLGMKALSFSSDIAMEEENKKAGKNTEKSIWDNIWMGVTVLLSFIIGLGLFFYVPLILTDLFPIESGIVFNLIDGIFRVIIFLSYIYLISLWKEIKRVFEFHGAEHKSVFAFEDQKELSIESARSYTTLHPRCGTSFLLIVMLVSILVFMFLGRPETIADRFLRIAFVPLIGGLSYEFIRFADRAPKRSIIKYLIYPGLWLQKITTKEPDDQQIEVAMVALRCALGQEPQAGPSDVQMVEV